MQRIPRTVAALRDALRFQNRSDTCLRSLNHTEWDELLRFCDLMKLTLVLSRVAHEALPEWLRSRISRDLQNNHERFERTVSAYQEMAAVFQDAGVEHLVLKGFAQWGSLLHPRDRMQGDVDLYCPPAWMDAARDSLRALGYEPLRGFEHSPSDHLPAMTRKNNWKWKGDYFDPDIPISVDLHHRLWDSGRAGFKPQGLEEFWERRVVRRVESFNFPALCEEDAFAYSALHALRHLLYGTMSISNLYEIAWFLHTRADDASFWRSWHDLHHSSLRQVQAVCSQLAAQWFQCDVPPAVAEEIQELPPAVHRWMHTYGDSPLLMPYRQNKDALWLHLTLAESAPAKRSVLYRGMFPTRLPAMDAVQVMSPPMQPHRSPSLQAVGKYLCHLARRARHHATILPETLWHGVTWWWSSKELSAEFHSFLGASFFYTLGMFVYFFLFNLYLLDMGYKENFLGMVTAAMAIGGMAGTIPAGLLAQRYGLKRAISICFGTVPIICAVRALLVADIPQLVLAFMLGAFASIWGVIISPTLAQLTTEKNRPFGFSIVFSTGIGVGVFGGFLGGQLPSWIALVRPDASSGSLKQIALLVASGLITLALWPISRFRSPSIQSRKSFFFPRNRFLLRFLPAIAVWSLATGAFSPFFNAYFAQHLHMPLQRIGYYFSAAQFLQVFAILLAPLVFKKFGLIAGVVYIQIAAAFTLACLARTTAASMAGLIYIAFSAFQWMSEPGMYSLLMNKMKPEERNSASAVNALVISSGQAIAALLAGAALARFDYPMVIAGVAAIALIAALLFRFLLHDSPPDKSTATPATVNPFTEPVSDVERYTA